MNFIELVKARRSVRAYADTPVEDEKIAYILESARNAPSACNFQPWIFVVLRSRESRNSLETVYNRRWLMEAPVVIVACCDRNASWKRSDGKEFGDIDVAIAVDHLTLAATEQGLGTCWIGAFNSLELKKKLLLPQHVEPIALTPLGYPLHETYTKTRKNSSEILYWEFFGGKNV